VQCVPKKGGVTVVKREKVELNPTRIVTGWKICMDYRNLDKATIKYPFHLCDSLIKCCTDWLGKTFTASLMDTQAKTDLL
jgi:hypothetical protein